MPSAPIRVRSDLARAIDPLAWSGVLLAVAVGLGACARGTGASGDDDAFAPAEMAIADAAPEAATYVDASAPDGAARDAGAPDVTSTEGADASSGMDATDASSVMNAPDTSAVSCVIGGQSYASAAVNPSDPCQVCEPSESSTSWTELPGNFYWCQNSCVNSLTDPNNCGACQNVCVSGSCVNGSCADQCSINGESYASGAVNPSDPCQECTPSTSTTSWTELPGNFYWCQNSCVNSLTDPNNCGACQNVCPGGEPCVNGGCVAP